MTSKSSGKTRRKSATIEIVIKVVSLLFTHAIFFSAAGAIVNGLESPSKVGRNGFREVIVCT